MVDNASEDQSAQLARQSGADVLRVESVGYGSAIAGGLTAAKGKYTIIADGDGQHDVGSLDDFIDKLREGYDLVVGNRYQGKATGGRRSLHRKLGNLLISLIGKWYFKVPIGDFNCGLRGMPTECARSLNLQCRGMEMASEIIVKASLAGFRVAEVPVVISERPDISQSHLRVWRDGWRHFRILLCLTPYPTFLYPGIFFITLGVVGVSVLFFGSIIIGGIEFNLHTMLLSSASIICGLQLLIFYVLAGTFQESIRITPRSWLTLGLRQRTFGDISLVLAVALLAVGVVGLAQFFTAWAEAGYSNLNPYRHMRILIFALSFFISGLQLASASFIYYLPNIKRI